jgi:hypothetical protein
VKRSPLRRSKPLNRSGKLNKLGRRGKRNLKAFYINRDFFEKHEINFCERCGKTWCLEMAHRFKRFDIKTFDELCITVLLCHECHFYVDTKLTKEQMHAELTRIINERETRFIEAP